MSGNLSPVVLFAYNRPDHLRRTLSALSAAKLAAETNLFIFSDGAKSGAETAVAEVREVCRQAEGFGSVKLVERSSNLGLARNIISALTDIFATYQTAIVLEDDIVVSEEFLVYMNEALRFYESMPVFSVSGYTPPVKIPADYTYSTYAMMRNCSWGWATWASRWARVDWEVSDFHSFITNADDRAMFNQCGTDLWPMLLRQRTGEINSWSIRFCYAAFKCGMPTVYPVTSLVENGGVDGSGTNMRRSRRYDTIVGDAALNADRFVSDLSIRDDLRLSFCSFYNTSLIRKFINYFKLLRYLIVYKFMRSK